MTYGTATAVLDGLITGAHWDNRGVMGTGVVGGTQYTVQAPEISCSSSETRRTSSIRRRVSSATFWSTFRRVNRFGRSRLFQTAPAPTKYHFIWRRRLALLGSTANSHDWIVGTTVGFVAKKLIARDQCEALPSRTLPFSCPFGAPKSGKWQQAPAQSEGRRSPDSSSDGARSGNLQHTAAKRG